MSSAKVKLFPPGAAQQSQTACPGWASSSEQASWAERSCTWNRPSWNSSKLAGEPSPSATAAQGRDSTGFRETPCRPKEAARPSAVARRGLIRKYSGARRWKASSSWAVSSFP